MKKYVKELIVLVIQLVIFYVFPLFAGPEDTMGLVGLMLVSTFVLAVLLGILSSEKVKYVYPVIVAIVFLPSIPVYYNDSALVHSIWYLVDSSIGLLLGSVIHRLIGIRQNG